MKALLYLNKYFVKYRLRLLLGVGFVVILNVFDVLVPRVVRLAFDKAHSLAILYQHINETEMANPFLNRILMAALLFGGLVILFTLLKGIFLFATRQTIIVMSRLIEYDLKNEVYDQYQRLPFTFFASNFTGDLMARISEDVSRVRMYLGPAIMYSLNMLFKLIFVIAIMFSINQKLSFYVLLPLPLLSFLIYKISAIINEKSDKIQKQMSRLTVFGQEAFSGIRVIKSFGAEKHFDQVFEKECEVYREKSMDLVKVNSLFMPLMIMLVGMSTVLTIYLGGKEVINGNFTYGNIAEFVIYVNMLTWPVASLGWVTAIVQRAAASQKRINEFLEEPITEENEDAVPFQFDTSIDFQNVTYTYPDKEHPAIKDLSISIPKGSTLGIIGHTGSGKSTIANLLLNLVQPGEGTVKIDDTVVTNIQQKSFKNAIAYVPQDVFLFSETIADNIAFGVSNLEELKQEDIENAAKQAGVHNDIIGFKNGYNTLLGERGISVSGGQKQRIAIARALLKPFDIIILDDCLSAVDLQTEALILDNFKSIFSDKTVVVISHRVSSVANADQVIVLEEGSIVEAGSPSDLLQKEGLYSSLFAKQQE